MVKHDDYMTPFSAWEDVSPYIPRHLTLWEAFYGDGTSGAHLTELGFDVIHEDVDFFEHDLGECVVTNPPFSELPRVLARLRELGKPFVVIMPCSTLTTKPSFRDDAKSHGAYHLSRTVRQRPGEDTKEEREKL